MLQSRVHVAVLVTAAVVSTTPAYAQAPASAVAAWDDYVARTEKRIQGEIDGTGVSLAVETLAPQLAAKAKKPAASDELLYVAPVSMDGRPGAADVPGGLRHHWLAAVYVPGVRVGAVLAFVQDYEHQAGAFEDVLVSKVLSRNGDHFEVMLRLRRKKVITAVYDTTHAVQYRTHDAARASSRSVATRIVELEQMDGSQGYRPRPEGKDRGFMWRLNSYWRFVEVNGGVVVECESLSLSRGIPTGLGWLIGRFVNSIPRESLEQTLFGIKRGTLARTRRS